MGEGRLTDLSFADVGSGHGGTHPDHEFFGYRQSI